jgi:hypothetical protein
MVGCDCGNFPDDEVSEASSAPFRPNILPPEAADDDAAPLAPPAAGAGAAAIDPHDFTKWNVLDVKTIPIAAQSYDAANISAHRSVHAGLVLFFQSNEMEAIMERAYPAGPSAPCAPRNVPWVAPSPPQHQFEERGRGLFGVLTFQEERTQILVHYFVH